MFIRTIENVIHHTRTAIRFATIVQRRGRLTNEASAPRPVPNGLMRQAYAEAMATSSRASSEIAAVPPALI